MPIGLRPWLPSLGLLLLLLTDPSQARAQASASFSFEWTAPAGCPSADEVNTEIERLLGGPAHAPATGALRVRAAVAHDSLWLVTLETISETRNGHRSISATSCQGLAHATALIVALMIDPDAVAAHSGKPETPEPAPAPPAAPAPLPPIPPPGRTMAVLAGLGAAGNLGALPSADLGLGASLGIAGALWRIELRGAYGFRQVRSATMSDPPGAFGRFHLVAGVLAGCLTLKQPALDWGPCVNVEFGVMRGEGVGANQTVTDTTPWLGLGAGGVLAFKATSNLYFPVHLDAIVPVWRPNFVFRNIESPIFRAAPLGGRLTAGVELRF